MKIWLIIEANNLFKTGTPNLKWASMAGYGAHLKTNGITHNLSTLAGHGTTRASIFINGVQVVENGRADTALRPGLMI